MKIIIMQGQSGAGKSTYVSKNHSEAVVCSADNYFINKDGFYNFDPTKLGHAHAECMRNFLDAMYHSKPEIVVDNTNTTQVEMAPYVQAGVAMGYSVEVVRCVTDVDTSARRNLHGVPFKAVEAMVRRMEKPAPFWACTFKEIKTD